MSLVKLLGGKGNSAPQTHPKDLASVKTPHVISAIVRGPARHRKRALLKLFLSDLERHDGIVALLDYGSLDHEFDGRQALSTISVFPVSNAEKLGALGAGQLERTTLSGLDLLGDTPFVALIGLGF